MSATEQLVDAYVDSLQAAYIKMRKEWNPKWSGHLHQVSDKQWRDSAALLAKYNLDPWAYIIYLFEEVGSKRGDLYETQVASFNMIETFKDDRPRQIAKAKMTIALNADNFKTRLDNGYKIDEILEDPYHEYSVVFKYAVAVSENLPKWIDEFKPQAEYVMMFEPTYAEVVSKYLKKGSA